MILQSLRILQGHYLQVYNKIPFEIICHCASSLQDEKLLNIGGEKANKQKEKRQDPTERGRNPCRVFHKELEVNYEY